MVIAMSINLCVAFMMGTPGAMEGPIFTPAGEFGARIQAVLDRFGNQTIEPRFTDDFILADVVLSPDYPRRFDNFSGDISGRFIGAVSMLPDPDQAKRLEGLVDEIARHQKPDGRFGTMDLSFAAADIGPENMALLWGNGRLLAGLMEYHQYSGSQKALECAQKLGGFLIGVYDTCSEPDVAKRLEGQAARGFICFTQLIEGLDMLYRATNNEQYLETAKRIVPLLEPRGIQHTHGYLTTLRGYLMLYETTGDPAILGAAEKLYGDLITSKDYIIYGGVMEYFGSKHDRDEGCSEADFLRLSLQLWQATGNLEYLELAERCLLNIFYANQFETGDFGHRRYDETGYIPARGAGRAWWCCTMHGYRAFADVKKYVVTEDKETVKINLFLDGTWSDGDTTLVVSRPGASEPQAAAFRVVIEKAPDSARPIAIRQPTWARNITVRVNGAELKPSILAAYMVLERAWQSGDIIEVDWTYDVRLVQQDGKVIRPDGLADRPVKAALFHGPWLLGVNEELDPYFHGEPWRENVIWLPASIERPKASVGPEGDPRIIEDAHLLVKYRHGGFPDPCTVTLRPISEQTPCRQPMVTTWLNFQKPVE
ncbi:MAG: glycoside hydrolase family 127 protein [Candidatus Hydrogenedentes bacterium]|nr:glycoside hydrolase family 127 protein [Candidatus Hydrogenedentota bacterium]